MNITQAKAALKKLYGAKAYWRYNEHALKSEEREALKASLPLLKQDREQARAAWLTRREELLKDPEYVRLLQAHKDAEKAHETALSNMHSWRVSVGINNGWACEIKAQGDNWQDAIDKARAKNGAT